MRFLTELGVGFAFVGRQYPIVVGDSEYRIDLLFYHCKLHCYVVLELKTRKARAEHFGQLGFYVSVVDDLVRDKERDEPHPRHPDRREQGPGDGRNTRCAGTTPRWLSARTPGCPRE